MHSSESARRRAEECHEHARRARDADVRAQWLEMAMFWLELAGGPARQAPDGSAGNDGGAGPPAPV
jgi:hypothetical protein